MKRLLVPSIERADEGAINQSINHQAIDQSIKQAGLYFVRPWRGYLCLLAIYMEYNYHDGLPG